MVKEAPGQEAASKDVQAASCPRRRRIEYYNLVV